MKRPQKASGHCRHYSYHLGTFLRDPDRGPTCALGVDLSEPGSSKMCWPSGGDARGLCSQRQDYTDEERALWHQWVRHGISMILTALDLFPPVPCGTEARQPCPHCDGTIILQRMPNGHAWLQCTGSDCIEPTHFNVDRQAVWPEPISHHPRHQEET